MFVFPRNYVTQKLCFHTVHVMHAIIWKIKSDMILKNDPLVICNSYNYACKRILKFKKKHGWPQITALGTQRNLERHKIADLKHSRSAKIRRHYTLFRAAFSIVLGKQNNVFTPNLSVEFEIILKISAKNVMKKCNEMSQFLSWLMDTIVQM